jgi:hypothetical protein
MVNLYVSKYNCDSFSPVGPSGTYCINTFTYYILLINL